jgi:hypothetical protein
LAARRLGQKIAKILLRLVGFSDLVLETAKQGVQHKHRQRASAVPPPPNSHAAHAKEPGSTAIGAKGYLEDEIMSAGGNPALEAQCYVGGTLLHGLATEVVCSTDPKKF